MGNRWPEMNLVSSRAKRLARRVPVLQTLARRLYVSRLRARWSGSEEYWIERYKAGGDSGPGSYNELARFKAHVLNEFVSRRDIATVIEYGCGDGNQLSLADYRSYLGFDVSEVAVDICRRRFALDETKRFKLMAEYGGESAELTMSLDVVYHLVETDVFESYMRRLFNSSRRFVVVYSSNSEQQDELRSPHIRHREFSRWINTNIIGWKLVQQLLNRHPYRGRVEGGSFADFYFYERAL